MSECYFWYHIRHRLYVQLTKSNKFEIFYNAPGVYKTFINWKIPIWLINRFVKHT